VPERPAEDAPDTPRRLTLGKSATLTERDGSPSSADSPTATAAGENEDDYYVDPAADFTAHAGELPGRAAPGSSRVRTQAKRLGWGFWVAVAWCLLVILLAIFANLLPLPNPNVPTSSCLSVPPGAGPGAGHILGCDANSRDILSRLIFGARVSLVVGFASIAIGLLFGGTLGLIAGYFRGFLDEVMSVVANAFLSFPYLVLALAIVAFLGNSMLDVTLIIALLAWPFLFRVVRASTIAHVERDYVLAARALGATRWRVVRKHLLADVIPSAVTYGVVGVGLAIVGEGALSFLGQSVADPTPTWGKMIAEGSNNITQNVSQLLAPSLAMFFTILAINFIGDRLRGLLDAREGVL
jgi:peptide/nickel transport system permease protein